MSEPDNIGGKHVAKAALWTVAGRTLSMGLKFLSIPILARILMPEEFGTVAISITVILFVAMLGGFGLPSALVADKRESTTLISNIFYFTLTVGCLLAVIMMLGASTTSHWLGAPDATKVITILSFLIPLQIIGDVSEAMLTRRMMFDKLAVWQVTADTAGAVVAIATALSGWGVWALVAQQLVSAIIRVSGNLYAAGIHLTPHWDLSEIRTMSHFGSRVMFSDLLLYLCIQGPVAIVTRILGTQATGFFSVPNRFVELPNQIILSSLATVLFPSFAAMSEQRERLANALLKSAYLTTALQTPVMFGLAVVAEPAMGLLFGEKWLEAWPVFAILAIAKGLIAPCGGFGSFLKGVNRADILWKVTAFRAALVIILCTLGALIGGLHGLVAGILITNILVMIGYSKVVFHIAGIPYINSIKHVLTPMIHAAVMAGLVSAILNIGSLSNSAPWIQLLIAVVTGGIIYSLMAWFLQDVTKKTAFQILKRH